MGDARNDEKNVAVQCPSPCPPACRVPESRVTGAWERGKEMRGRLLQETPGTACKRTEACFGTGWVHVVLRGRSAPSDAVSAGWGYGIFKRWRNSQEGPGAEDSVLPPTEQLVPPIVVYCRWPSLEEAAAFCLGAGLPHVPRNP